LGLGRDPERTPMQWDASPGAGFSTAEPWLPLAPDWARRNVQSLKDDAGSILTLYRLLIEARRRHRALSIGDYLSLHCRDHVFAYERRYGRERLMVALNLGHDDETLALPADAPAGEILLSTDLDREAEPVESAVAIRRDEGVIIKLGDARS
ncbi:MAG TPA: DUF3459 domain-containing protein, partial [Beijerinckiaceae bacterium]|nr:DUF3459 domain-containing protein [Beijerinckiaceae bacterium]